MISKRISDDIPPQNFKYGYLQSSALLQSHLKLEHYKPHKAARHPTKYDVINDVKQFPIVYRRKWALSNQTSRYKSKCIRMYF